MQVDWVNLLCEDDGKLVFERLIDHVRLLVKKRTNQRRAPYLVKMTSTTGLLSHIVAVAAAVLVLDVKIRYLGGLLSFPFAAICPTNLISKHPSKKKTCSDRIYHGLIVSV